MCSREKSMAAAQFYRFTPAVAAFFCRKGESPSRSYASAATCPSRFSPIFQASRDVSPSCFACLELVPKPSVQPALSPVFVEHFVEPRGFWPFSTKWADQVHDKGPAGLSWYKLYLSVVQLRGAA